MSNSKTSERLLMDSQQADVFVVGNEGIPGHRLVFAVNCVYFKQLLDEHFKDFKRVIVDETSVQVFNVFKRYIYVGQLEFADWKAADLLPLLSAARISGHGIELLSPNPAALSAILRSKLVTALRANCQMMDLFTVVQSGHSNAYLGVTMSTAFPVTMATIKFKATPIKACLCIFFLLHQSLASIMCTNNFNTTAKDDN